ncbi:hypothetical protein SHO565_68700 [Streptomyces sp. HO565]
MGPAHAKGDPTWGDEREARTGVWDFGMDQCTGQEGGPAEMVAGTADGDADASRSSAAWGTVE